MPILSSKFLISNKFFIIATNAVPTKAVTPSQKPQPPSTSENNINDMDEIMEDDIEDILRHLKGV